MRLAVLGTLFLSIHSVISVSTPPRSSRRDDVIPRDESSNPQSQPISDNPAISSPLPLVRRKGGGGGGRGGSGSRGGSSSGGSNRGSSGGSSGSRSAPPSTSRNSNTGGRTSSGSGPKPRFGQFYTGGAAAPYTASRRSPSGISPRALPVAALAFFPGLWLFSNAYAYPFDTKYRYRPRKRRNSNNNNQEEEIVVEITCVCQEYSVCGCDDNGNDTYVREVLTDGGLEPVNTSEVVILPPFDNGTQKAYINGTLPNGTTAEGDEDDEDFAAVPVDDGVGRVIVKYAGYWTMFVTVLATVLAS